MHSQTLARMAAYCPEAIGAQGKPLGCLQKLERNELIHPSLAYE